MKAKLVHVEVPIDSSSKDSSLAFYAKLFDTPLARSLTDEVESYHIPISRDGTWLSVGARTGNAKASHIICHFAVDDLNSAINELKAAGGSLVNQVVEVNVSNRATDYYKRRLHELNAHPRADSFHGPFFKVAYLRDPDGNLLALMEVDEVSRHWFGLDAGPTAAQQIGHQKALDLGDQFAAGKTLP